MEIVIVSPGMPFGPSTLEHKSLGGSETAALSLAAALKRKGHIVTVFCNLPAKGEPDYIEPGSLGADQVRYVHMDHYRPFITSTEVDLLIASRSPELLHLNHQARKAVLWTHDLATYAHTQPMLSGIAWNIDAIWCVSEWHRQQYHEVTGFPLDHIAVLPNGVNIYDVAGWEELRSTRTFLYAARPERGLEALVRPGGVMDHLPSDYKLDVCFYSNFPPHMQQYYDWLFNCCRENPKVNLVGPQTQEQLRQRMASAAGYLYPTAFEETSCIMAQEAMSVLTPFYTTPVGALPETLGRYGDFYHSSDPWNSDQFCKGFAEFVIQRQKMGDVASIKHLTRHRTWDEVAEVAIELARPPYPKLFTHLWGMIETSDVVPALAYWNQVPDFLRDQKSTLFMDRVRDLYPYLTKGESFASYYERYFVREDTKGARVHRSSVGNQRFEVISEEVAKVTDGGTILDYGCAEGVNILDLAQRFPKKFFIGMDFAQSNVDLCTKYAQEMGLNNVSFEMGSTESFPEGFEKFDAVICTEVLEHVPEPWTVIGFLEQQVKIGGRVIITVPMGNWEAIGLYDKDQYWWRAHIWNIDKWMLREMFRDKSNSRMMSLPHGATPEGRALGHTVFCYDADGNDVHPVDPIEKADRLRTQETVAACMIVNSWDTLAKTLNSIATQVHMLVIGNSGEGENRSRISDIVGAFRANHPWIMVDEINQRPIKAREWGFDDARNETIAGVPTDWVLWIDGDEYLSGDIRKYLRPNAFDSYAISQHHFTVDPRGAPAQIDKPARLFRTDRGFKFYGKVHEHAEKGYNGGPAFCMVLGDVDIGHTGYVNEGVRRGRFNRNFPLLEWDHEVNPDRRLGQFLWLRDIIHRMRFHADQRDVETARLLAEEALSYYAAHWSGEALPGMGGENAAAYRGEALLFLGRGKKIAFSFKYEEEVGEGAGVFENADEIGNHVKLIFAEKFKKRDSKYWS